MKQGEQQVRDYGGRFEGVRVNREQVPMLPASIVRRVWDDPRRIPYLLLWKGRQDGKLKEAVRIMRVVGNPGLPEAASVEVKRPGGSAMPIYLVWRWQPHGGNSLLLRCWRCHKPRRELYGVRVAYGAIRQADWECRICARLSYSSEGEALIFRGGVLSKIFGQPTNSVTFSGPKPWLPFIFSSLQGAVAASL